MKTLNTTTTERRPLYAIANDIRRDWKNVNYAAKPYLSAMAGMGDINESFGWDSGKETVLRFLCNAGSWRGDVAKQIKAELKALTK